MHIDVLARYRGRCEVCQPTKGSDVPTNTRPAMSIVPPHRSNGTRQAGTICAANAIPNPAPNKTSPKSPIIPRLFENPRRASTLKMQTLIDAQIPLKKVDGHYSDFSRILLYCLIFVIRSSILAFLLDVLSPNQAQAHVKWFAHYDVAQAPLAPAWITGTDFIILTCVALAALTVGVLIENAVIGRVATNALDRATMEIRAQSDTLMRATFGGFFVALWTLGGIILTPELITDRPLIPWAQLAIAMCFIWRPTLPAASLGIVGLYAWGMIRYGVFHLLDYPIFLGAAAYFTLMATGLRPGGMAPLPVLRNMTAVTLMWASVEKWAYPDWTYPLFVSHPVLAMGFTPQFYMIAAGVVEFTLALALFGPTLVRRVAAILLTTIFFTAVLEFGKIDAIGHAPIMAVLIAIAADDTPGRRWSPALVPICYLAALAATIAVYYLLHFVLFQPQP